MYLHHMFMDLNEKPIWTQYDHVEYFQGSFIYWVIIENSDFTLTALKWCLGVRIVDCSLLSKLNFIFIKTEESWEYKKFWYFDV